MKGIKRRGTFGYSGDMDKGLEAGDCTCPSFNQKILALDLYNKEFAFLMPDHHERYRTHFGSCLSIVTLITVIFYGGWKLLDMLSYNIYNVQTVSEENYFSSNDTFTIADGFYVAAAITSYNNDPNPIEDPDIGTLKMYLKTWNVYDEENGGL